MTDNSNHGIGIVGAGLIIQHAHLPAYRDAGYRVAAITDVKADLAAQVGSDWNIPVMDSIEQLVANPDVQIVDIAITPKDQAAVVRMAIAAGKNVLAQKPLSLDLDVARALAHEAQAAGVLLAVNQQMRFGPAVRAMRAAIDSGFVGDPVTLHYHVDIAGEYARDHWLSHEPRFMASFGTIHYVDSARYLFGEPESVTARLWSDPGQNSAGETFINAWIEWPNGARLIAYERYTNKVGPETSYMRLDGTRGTVRASLGIYDDYPNPKPDLIERSSFAEPGWVDVSDGTTWLPDAFAGPMGGLIKATKDGGIPPTRAFDHLRNLEIVDAIYRSDAEKRTIQLPNLSAKELN